VGLGHGIGWGLLTHTRYGPLGELFRGEPEGAVNAPATYRMWCFLAFTVVEGDSINLYYGAADSSVALARGSVHCRYDGSIATHTGQEVSYETAATTSG
jgi:hypothetical protein